MSKQPHFECTAAPRLAEDCKGSLHSIIYNYPPSATTRWRYVRLRAGLGTKYTNLASRPVRKICPAASVTSFWWSAWLSRSLHTPGKETLIRSRFPLLNYRPVHSLHTQSKQRHMLINRNFVLWFTCNWCTKPTLGLMQNLLSWTWLKASLQSKYAESYNLWLTDVNHRKSQPQIYWAMYLTIHLWDLCPSELDVLHSINHVSVRISIILACGHIIFQIV